MPLTWHHLTAMLAAALAPALVTGAYAALSGSPDLFLACFVAAFIIAAMHVGLVAMPIFAILSRRWRPRLWNILPAAFLVGALPLTFLLLALSNGSENSVWVGGVQTIDRGARTLAGWIEMGQAGLVLGLLGVTGGLAFWLVARTSEPAK